MFGSLAKNELKSFDNFISYNLNGKKSDVLNYWKYKYSESPGYPDGGIQKNFSRKTLSDFNKQIEKYFIWKNLESDAFTEKILLFREFRKRNIVKYPEQLLGEIKNDKNKQIKKSLHKYINRLKLNLEEFYLYNAGNDFKKLNEVSEEHIKILELLVLKSSLFAFVNGKLYANNYISGELVKYQDISAYMEKNKRVFKKNHPYIWLLYNLSKININSRNDKCLNPVFELIKENHENVSDEFLQFVYETLFNILIIKINNGCCKNIRSFYDILLHLENTGTLKLFKDIQPRTYLNFVHTSIIFENMEFAEKLIFEYNYMIAESVRKNALNICLAMVAFSKGNYQKAKSLLANIKTHEQTLYFFCKTLLLKTYYELSEFRNIYPLIDTVSHYLKRRSHYREFTPFIKIFLKYLNILSSSGKSKEKKLELLKPALADDNLFYQKQWIIEKYFQLKNFP